METLGGNYTVCLNMKVAMIEWMNEALPVYHLAYFAVFLVLLVNGLAFNGVVNLYFE